MHFLARPRLVISGLAIVAGAALVLVGCGSSGTSTAASAQGDASETTSEQSTSEGDTSEPESEPTTAGSDTAATPAPEPTPRVDASIFSETVLPVLENACASCHNEGQAGADRLLLDTAADAQAGADGIRLLTVSRAMPPWPASDLGPDYYGDHSLTDDEIEAVVQWADGGAPIDVEPDTPIVSAQPPSFLSEEHGERDIVMTSASGPYTGSAETPDDYRCLIFEPGNDELEWVLATHFEADQVEVVHHGIISLVSASLREEAASLDAAEPGPGWTCYGGNGLGNPGSSTEEVRRAGGWAPGAPPSRRPAGYATPLYPGDFFVVQIHYHYQDEAPADLSRFVLDLASDEQIAEAGGEFATLRSQLYLGPAEIPCYEGDTHPLCDRDAALARVRDLYGGFTAALPNFFLRSCDADVSDFSEMTDGDAWSTCDLPVRNPGRIVSVTGHMHELGKSIRLTLNPGTPEERILLDIPDWDFEWQLGYAPIEDIVIDGDDIIRVDCSWNRERAPYEAVGYVLWSDGTGDEMCYSSITTAPVEPGVDS